MSKPVEFQLRRSRQQLIWLLAIHILVFILLLMLPLHWGLQTGLLLWVLVGAALYIRKWQQKLVVTLAQRQGQWFYGGKPVELSRWQNFGKLILLRFNKASLMIFPDSLAESDYCQLQQRLRFPVRTS